MQGHYYIIFHTKLQTDERLYFNSYLSLRLSSSRKMETTPCTFERVDYRTFDRLTTEDIYKHSLDTSLPITRAHLNLL